MNQLENLNLINSTINSSTINGSNINSPMLICGNIEGTILNNNQIMNANITCSTIDVNSTKINNSRAISLGQIIDELQEELQKQKKFNKVLVNILIQKGILDDISEYEEILDAFELAGKLAGKEVV